MTITWQRPRLGSAAGARSKSFPERLSEIAPKLLVLNEAPRHRSWKAFLKVALIVGVISGFGILINLRQARTNVAMLYLAGVVFSALRWGFEPALFSAILSGVVFDYVFVPPYFSFAVTDIWYLITVVVMTAVGIVISVLASAAREQTLAAREREAYTTALYSLTQALSAARDVEQVFRAAAEHIQTAAGSRVAFLLAEASQELVVRYQTPGWELDAETRAAARRFHQDVSTGYTVQNNSMFLPLNCGARLSGLVVLMPPKRPAALSSARKNMLEGIAGQVALAVERAVLEERAREADLLRKAQEFHRSLLNSVSHSLRAPLAAILSALDLIGDPDAEGASAPIVELARVAHTEADRLDRLVGNLLDLSRLEAGALRLRREPHGVENLVGAALAELSEWKEARIKSAVPPELPAVLVDFGLMVRVLVNLLENALKYSPPGLPVQLDARTLGEQVEIRVSDRGYGIPATERERIFQRFFRGTQGGKAPGLGLGLAVSKGFVEAHNGRIWMEERPGGGSVFCFTMPMQDLQEAL